MYTIGISHSEARDTETGRRQVVVLFAGKSGSKQLELDSEDELVDKLLDVISMAFCRP